MWLCFFLENVLIQKATVALDMPCTTGIKQPVSSVFLRVEVKENSRRIVLSKDMSSKLSIEHPCLTIPLAWCRIGFQPPARNWKKIGKIYVSGS